MADNNTEKKQASVGIAITSMVLLVLILIGGFAWLSVNTHAVFVIAIIAMSIMALIAGHSLDDIQGYFITGCKNAILVSLILMTVGTVIGSWIVSGVVPAIIYYGLTILSPKVFLLVGFIICCVVSFFVGSSYSAIATLGVAFMGIGMGLGINPGLTAGMVVSGAIFGDKMSPFSDTTNLAPAVAGTDIFKHINSMLYTTVPATVITAIIFALQGMKISASSMDMSTINDINNTLLANFNINPILLIVPVFTIVLAVKKVPTLVALLLSSVAATVFAFIFQHDFYSAKVILSALGNGFTITSENAAVNRLLTRGGVLGMMSASSLALLALGLGEILQRMGVIDVVLGKLAGIIRGKRSLVVTTLATCLITTCLTASQYIAIILPGEVMKNAYTRFKVDKRVLSRSLEDGGTIFAFLIPWSTTGIYVTSTLDIPVMEYAPFTYLALLCPLIALIYALTGFAIFPDKNAESEKAE